MMRRSPGANKVLPRKITGYPCHFDTDMKTHHCHLAQRGSFVVLSKSTSLLQSLSQSLFSSSDLQNPLSPLPTLPPHHLCHSRSLALPQSSSWPSMADSETSKGTTLRHAFGNVLSLFILLLIGVLAFSIRLFSVNPLILNPRHFSSRSKRYTVLSFIIFFLAWLLCP